MATRLHRLLILTFFLAVSSFAQTAAPAQKVSGDGATSQSTIDPVKEKDIRRLMQVAQMNSLVNQLMDGMVANIKPVMMESLPAGDYRSKLIDLFFEKFRSKADPQDLIGMAIPLYDKYFTDEEIKGLIKFYETPLGQKAISALPQLTVEMQEAGQKWGENLGRDSMREVLAEHPDLAEAMKTAAGKPQP